MDWFSATDDCVCILLGCSTPILLRPESSGRFKVVGECYVHGVMNSEGLLGPLPDTWKVQVRFDAASVNIKAPFDFSTFGPFLVNGAAVYFFRTRPCFHCSLFLCTVYFSIALWPLFTFCIATEQRRSRPPLRCWKCQDFAKTLTFVDFID